MNIEIPEIIGYPQKPWTLFGLSRDEWLAAPDQHRDWGCVMALAHTLNVAADQHDLPFAADYPPAYSTAIRLLAAEPWPFCGNVMRNPTWQSFWAWDLWVSTAPERYARWLREVHARSVLAAKNNPVMPVCGSE